MNIICFGQQNWDVTWTEKQQHMTRLVRRGHRILYVDPDWTHEPAAAIDKVRTLAPVSTRCGLRELVPGSLYVFTYRFAPLLRWRFNARHYRATLGRLARRLYFPDPVVVAFRPDAALDAIQPRASLYYAVDEQTAYGGISPEWQQRIREQEDAMLRRVDVALGVAPRLVDRFRTIQPRSYILENGVDPDHFAPERLARIAGLPQLRALPRPRLGFIGQIDERIDQPLLVEVARTRREWHIVLVGRVKDGVDVSALRAEPNIHFVDFQTYERLPNALREIDVCLVPYRLTTLTNSCNPAKIFEYIATGLPVVSTPLDGIRVCRPVIALAKTASGFIAAIDDALDDPAAGRSERLRVAAESHWENRVDEMEDRLGEAVAVAAEGGQGGSARRRSVPARQLARLPGPPHRWHEHGWPARGPALPSTLSRGVYRVSTFLGRGYYAGRLAVRWLRGGGPPRIRKILVVRRTYLGDTVAILPMLEALRSRYPQAYIILGVQPGMSASPLLHESAAVDEVRVLDFLSRPTLIGRLKGMAGIFGEGFDAVVSGIGCFLLREAFFTGAPFRVGLYDGHPLQRLDTRVIPQDLTRHESENNLDLVHLLPGVSRPELTPSREVSVPPAGQSAAESLFNTLGIPAGARVVAVHPGAKRPSRRWPAGRFTELIERLLADQPELWIVFTGVADEMHLVEGIRLSLPDRVRERTRSAAGQTDVAGLMGVVQRSALVVSNDTGTMHVARALGVPVVALLGPESHRRWGPHPQGSAPAVALRTVVPCAPCSKIECDALYCMRSLRVDDVLRETRRLLEAADTGDSAGDLVARIGHRSWRALADAGFELPLVSIIVAEDCRGARSSITRQSYPAIEVLLAESCGHAPEPDAWKALLGPLPVRVVSDTDSEGAGQAAVEAAAGEFLIFWGVGDQWGAEHVTSGVAALFRDEQIDNSAGAVIPRVIPSGIAPLVRGAAIRAEYGVAGHSPANAYGGIHVSAEVPAAAGRPAIGADRLFETPD